MSALDIELFAIDQGRLYALPDPDIDPQPTGNEAVVVGQISIAGIDQIKHGIVRAPLLQIEFHHPVQGCGRVALIPFDLAH